MSVNNKVGPKSLNVLLIGNNPINLSQVYDRLKEYRLIKYEAETAFDPKDVFRKIKKFKPDSILIDDNMEKEELSEILSRLRSNISSKHIPITIIQHTNKDDHPRDGADEFILREEISSESLHKTILSSLKIHDLKDYLKQAYNKRKSMLGGLK